MPRHKNKTSFYKNNPRVTKPKSEEFKKRLSELRTNKIKTKCDFCNAELMVVPSRIKNLKHFFCNKICYHKWQHESDWFNKRIYNFTKEGRKRTIDAVIKWAKKNWKKKTKKEKNEWIYKMSKNQKRHLTKPESKVLNIIDIYRLNYKYTGDKTFWIENINPDFIDINNKIVIEVFGNYWHGKFKSRIKDFFKYLKLFYNGWRRIVLWEKYINKNSDITILNKIKMEEEIINGQRRMECHFPIFTAVA